MNKKSWIIEQVKQQNSDLMIENEQLHSELETVKHRMEIFSQKNTESLDKDR